MQRHTAQMIQRGIYLDSFIIRNWDALQKIAEREPMIEKLLGTQGQLLNGWDGVIRVPNFHEGYGDKVLQLEEKNTIPSNQKIADALMEQIENDLRKHIEENK